MRRPLPTLAAITIALTLTGCGSGGSTTGTAPAGGTAAATTRNAAARAAARKDEAAAKAAEAEAPKGASPSLRAIYRSFPAPRPAPGETDAAGSAIRAGERACAGKTPLEVKEEFYAEARRYLEPEQAKMIARIASFEAQETTDPSFVAGQLAADVYAATLEEEEAQAGYEGCIHALAQGLERRLAPAKK